MVSCLIKPKRLILYFPILVKHKQKIENDNFHKAKLPFVTQNSEFGSAKWCIGKQKGENTELTNSCFSLFINYLVLLHWFGFCFPFLFWDDLTFGYLHLYHLFGATLLFVSLHCLVKRFNQSQVVTPRLALCQPHLCHPQSCRLFARSSTSPCSHSQNYSANL